MKNHFNQLISALNDYPDAMGPSSLHGFLTALAIGPDEAIEQPWLQVILNIPTETILSEAMEELENSAMFAFDQIMDELADKRFHPHIKKPDADSETLKAWCHGFQQATLLAESEWEVLHDEHPDAARNAMTIAALLKPEIAETAFGIPAEKHEAFVAGQAPLLGSIIDAYYQVFIGSGFAGIEDVDLKPPTMEELPKFSKEELTGKSNNELLQLLSILGDALPHEVILESIQRATPMVEMLNQYLADDKHWDEEQDFGEDSWWTRLHAIMILGGIPGEMAGQGLVNALNRMNNSDDLLWEWLAGYWPAFFQNKPEATHQALHALAEDTKLDWYIRHQATESVLAHADLKGQETLEQALDWLANLMADENEDKEFRYMEGCTLLDFVPERHRPLLEKIADEQEHIRMGAIFVRSDVNQAFKKGKSTPEWERFDNPWEFYDPKKVLERQQQWYSEETAFPSFSEDEEQDEARQNYQPRMVETYTRGQPKTGRNDPCPCGSGKKYKKCCLH